MKTPKHLPEEIPLRQDRSPPKKLDIQKPNEKKITQLIKDTRFPTVSSPFESENGLWTSPEPAGDSLLRGGTDRESVDETAYKKYIHGEIDMRKETFTMTPKNIISMDSPIANQMKGEYKFQREASKKMSSGRRFQSVGDNKLMSQFSQFAIKSEVESTPQKRLASPESLKFSEEKKEFTSIFKPKTPYDDDSLGLRSKIRIPGLKQRMELAREEVKIIEEKDDRGILLTRDVRRREVSMQSVLSYQNSPSNFENQIAKEFKVRNKKSKASNFLEPIGNAVIYGDFETLEKNPERCKEKKSIRHPGFKTKQHSPEKLARGIAIPRNILRTMMMENIEAKLAWSSIDKFDEESMFRRVYTNGGFLKNEHKPATRGLIKELFEQGGNDEILQYDTVKSYARKRNLKLYHETSGMFRKEPLNLQEFSKPLEFPISPSERNFSMIQLQTKFVQNSVRNAQINQAHNRDRFI